MKGVVWLALLLMLCGLQQAAVINPADVDLNDDLTVDIIDLSALWEAWLSHSGPLENWNELCDLSDPPDGVIDEHDLAKFSSDWLVTIPEPNEFICLADIDHESPSGYGGLLTSFCRMAQ